MIKIITILIERATGAMTFFCADTSPARHRHIDVAVRVHIRLLVYPLCRVHGNEGDTSSHFTMLRDRTSAQTYG